ncbi:uncharacterized protein BDR25DRAFT_359549 [Lindgomyces ingoldianus]|uniref:Uncharacterized protein n=1 Tax=Lindgomyces ingoldianus TaxID=673940 RepID=A0ACB6QJ88_9PLEO|nr:uncharacterized protein BDR25DRAFT_359549 [Lindgomyces ingoldianus]KAF2466643.1 hypothetical protein BDR25DRAFT_359549 [Lindgomyces ingoldianus]
MISIVARIGEEFGMLTILINALFYILIRLMRTLKRATRTPHQDLDHEGLSQHVGYVQARATSYSQSFPRQSNNDSSSYNRNPDTESNMNIQCIRLSNIATFSFSYSDLQSTRSKSPIHSFKKSLLYITILGYLLTTHNPPLSSIGPKSELGTPRGIWRISVLPGRRNILRAMDIKGKFIEQVTFRRYHIPVVSNMHPPELHCFFKISVGKYTNLKEIRETHSSLREDEKTPRMHENISLENPVEAFFLENRTANSLHAMPSRNVYLRHVPGPSLLESVGSIQIQGLNFLPSLKALKHLVYRTPSIHSSNCLSTIIDIPSTTLPTHSVPHNMCRKIEIVYAYCPDACRIFITYIYCIQNPYKNDPHLCPLYIVEPGEWKPEGGSNANDYVASGKNRLGPLPLICSAM